MDGVVGRAYIFVSGEKTLGPMIRPRHRRQSPTALSDTGKPSPVGVSVVAAPLLRVKQRRRDTDVGKWPVCRHETKRHSCVSACTPTPWWQQGTQKQSRRLLGMNVSATLDGETQTKATGELESGHFFVFFLSPSGRPRSKHRNTETHVHMCMRCMTS